jgi:hypothetical protein
MEISIFTSQISHTVINITDDVVFVIVIIVFVVVVVVLFVVTIFRTSRTTTAITNFTGTFFLWFMQSHESCIASYDMQEVVHF